MAAAFALTAACSAPRHLDAPPLGSAVVTNGKVFHDVAQQSGIRHRHHKPILDHKLDNIMPWVASVGAAAAAADYDNDGWIDLYVTDSDKGQPNHLYRNNGDGTFTDVAAQAGLAEVNGEDGVSMDCVWGDYDNDGDADLYLVRWGRNALFRNNGDGTFTDVTGSLFRQRDGNPGADWANANAALFFDFNLDGRMDIYVGNYFEEHDLWKLNTTRIMHDSFETARNGGRNFLYRQEADGTFREMGAEAGVDDPGWTLAVGSADVNNDSWPDLYVADDFGPDQLYLNARDGTFRNATESAIGVDTKKGMNVDFGDFDNDGWLDIYVANITTAEYLQEGNMLWHNNGTDDDENLTLVDVSLETGTYDGGWGWGAKFFDYDNDADLDIVAVNGFISAGEGNYWYDLASWTVKDSDPADARNWPTIADRSFSGYERTRLWRNEGIQTFAERAVEVGLDSVRDGRGVVCFDYDNDGDQDVFVANQDQPPHLFRNDGTPGNHWILLALQPGPYHGGNRDGIGTRVTVVTDGGRQIRERDGGNGFCGQSDPRLHFGLGSEDRIRLMEIRWPDGGLQYLEDIRADQIVVVRQDPNQYATQVALSRGDARIWNPPTDLREPEISQPSFGAVQMSVDSMEQALEDGGGSWTLGSQYRIRCAAEHQHDRAIALFKRLIDKDPSDFRNRIQLACAYVDKIPTCGGMAAIVSKGTLARKSLDELDRVLAEHPDLWVARYCRGVNHLHWPRALRHSDAAVADLTECTRPQGRGESLPPDLDLRVFVLLGDAFAKGGNFSRAQEAWRNGLRRHPESTALSQRLAITDNAALLKLVESQRSLERPIDTDLSFLDWEP